MTDEVRKWEDKPYGPNDSKIFSVFERDLMDDLKSTKGFRQVFLNSSADTKTAHWLNMIIYVESDAVKLIQESKAKLEEVDEQPETIETVNATKVNYCAQLTKKLYGHKLRDLEINKIKLWQKTDNVKSLIEARVTL